MSKINPIILSDIETISENETPKLLDQVFFLFHFFDNLDKVKLKLQNY